MFTLSDFDFNLPPELIAQTALTERSASRLLDVDNRTAPAAFTDRQFTDIARTCSNPATCLSSTIPKS